MLFLGEFRASPPFPIAWRSPFSALLSGSAGERAHGRGGERLHLADGDLVETFQTVALRKVHVDEFRVHSLDVC